MMKPNNFLDNKAPVCTGTGLVALDVVIGNEKSIPAQFLAGGSCGNVLAILSYLGWESFPIARLSNNVAAEMLIEDLAAWNVNDDLISLSSDGSTPIIIHRILKDKQGSPKHRFEFRNPEDGSYLPSYKPVLRASVKEILEKKSTANVFYFDRINRGSIELAKSYKQNGAVIFFEPSSAKEIKLFNECLEIADVVKFSHDRILAIEEFPLLLKVPLTIQTLGEQGLRYKRSSDKNWSTLESFHIDDVVDSAGAGDWCTAGIIKSLFKDNSSLKNISHEKLIQALQFGQALSSLNCTYEGARGLMYTIVTNELLLYIEHILKSNTKKIPSRIKTLPPTNKIKAVKISSLFAAV